MSEKKFRTTVSFNVMKQIEDKVSSIFIREGFTKVEKPSLPFNIYTKTDLYQDFWCSYTAALDILHRLSKNPCLAVASLARSAGEGIAKDKPNGWFSLNTMDGINMMSIDVSYGFKEIIKDAKEDSIPKEEVKLCALKPCKVDLITGDITLFLDPNGERLLKNINLPIDPKEHCITMVVYAPGHNVFAFADTTVTLFIPTNEHYYTNDVRYKLHHKLTSLGLRRCDVFCSWSKVFEKVIKPMLKDVPNSDTLSYYILDDIKEID